MEIHMLQRSASYSPLPVFLMITGLFLAFTPFLSTVFSRDLPGPIHDAYMPAKSFHTRIVYSTGGATVEVEKIKTKLQKLADWSNSLNKNKFRMEVIPDTDFRPEMFGRDGLQIVGPFKYNKVLQKYYSDIPFKFGDREITVGDKVIRGENLSVGLIWPQPGNEEYTIIATGVSYAAFDTLNSGTAGQSDFVIHSDRTRKKNDKYSFELLGNFHREAGKAWSIDPAKFVLPENARKFYIDRAMEQASNRKPPEAKILDIELRDSMKVRGKLIRGDANNVIIRLYDSENNPSGFMEIPINSIVKADDSELICTKIHCSDQSAQMQYFYWEIVNNHSLRARAILSIVNTKLHTIEFLPHALPFSNVIEKVRDMFGNDMEFKAEKVPNQELTLYNIKLNYPVSPGETLNLRVEMTFSNTVKEIPSSGAEGKIKSYQLDQDLGGLAGAPFRLGILLPEGTEFVSSYPKEKLINTTPQGEVVIIEGFTPERFDSIPIILEYREKAK